jgi:hypothetical protein
MTPGSLNTRPAAHAGPTGLGAEYQIDIHTESELAAPVATVSFRAEQADVAAVLAWRLLAAYPGPADRFGELYARNQQDGNLADFLVTVELADLPGDLDDLPGGLDELPQDHAGQLEQATRQQLLAMAADYVRLRAAIEQTMADPGDWDDLPGGDLARLRRCLENLAAAWHGTCARCGAGVRAAQPFTVLPRRPWWHPRCWIGRRYRIAHRRCLDRQP